MSADFAAIVATSKRLLGTETPQDEPDPIIRKFNKRNKDTRGHHLGPNARLRQLYRAKLDSEQALHAIDQRIVDADGELGALAAAKRAIWLPIDAIDADTPFPPRDEGAQIAAIERCGDRVSAMRDQLRALRPGAVERRNQAAMAWNQAAEQWRSALWDAYGPTEPLGHWDNRPPILVAIAPGVFWAEGGQFEQQRFADVLAQLEA